MAEIAVELAADGDGWVATVEVREGGGASRHVVTVARAVRDSLAGEGGDPATLVEQSFRFLLEREPKEAILSRFDLPVIGRYFPEYEREIADRLAGG